MPEPGDAAGSGPEPRTARPPHRRGGRVPRWLLRTGQLGLTVLVTWFVADRVGLSLAELARFDPGRWNPRWGLIAASCLVLGAGYAVSALLWARMVREMGGPHLRAPAALRVYMVANLGRYVPGKVLQIVGLAVLARREGVPAPVSTGAAVLGQGVAILGATLVGLGAFFGPNEAWRIWGWAGLGAVAVFVVLTSLPGPAAALERLWVRVASRGGRLPPEDRDSARRAGFGVRWTLWYALNWGIYAAAFWLLFLGLEGWTTFIQAGPAFAAAYVAGYLMIFAPAGLGVREASLTAFLAPVLAPEPAAALAVVARLWTTGVELVPAGVLALLEARRGPRDETSGSETGWS